MNVDEADGSRAGEAIACVSAVLALACVAVGLRSYTRAVVLSHFGIDDAAFVVALAFTIACGITVAWNTRNGLGRHMWTVTPDMLTAYYRGFYLSIVLYNVAVMFTKAGFLLQYYRIFGAGLAGSKGLGRLQVALHTASVVTGLWSICFVLLTIFSCTPMEKFWHQDMSGICLPLYEMFMVNASGNIVTDAIIFILPMPLLGFLKLRLCQKMALLAVFGLGFFTCTISLIRIHYVRQSVSADLTWDNLPTACWSVGELACGITCGCLTTLRPLLSSILPTFLAGGDTNQATSHTSHTSRAGRRKRSLETVDPERGRLSDQPMLGRAT